MQNFLKNKKFLILGGSGFVGKSIIENLLNKGAKVAVLTRNSNKIKPLKVLFHSGQLEIIQGNIFDRDMHGAQLAVLLSEMKF